ncbi:2-epi-5-epi-valiolone epimerase [subsurface metagenome]
MIIGIHHFSFSVTDINKTVDFLTNVLGVTLRSRSHNKYDTLGTALFGTKWGFTQASADLEIAVIQIGNSTVEFIEYKDPKAQPYHKNPSIAGSAHLAFRVDDIAETRKKLEKAGVEFHSPINTFMEGEKVGWRWCYFRGPDGLIFELVEQKEEWK